MNNINSVALTGNVVHDVGERDFSYVGEKAKLNFTIAVNKNVKRNGEWTNEAMFFDVTLWGKQAESLKPYITKGKGVALEGALSQDHWEKDGQKKSKIYISASNVQLLGGGKEKSNSANATSDFPEDIPYDDPKPSNNELIF